MSKETDWLEWVRRITQGDSAAEAELVGRYRDGVAIIIGRIVHNESITEDLTQETFRISLEKIRNGDVRDPERLSGFICGVARNVAGEHARKTRRRGNHEDIGDAEQIRDPRPDPFDQLLSKERAEIVRQVISELKVQRDREILFRYYIAQQEKGQICADLGLGPQQFNSIIFRALKRYKELLLKRFGKL